MANKSAGAVRLSTTLWLCCVNSKAEENIVHQEPADVDDRAGSESAQHGHSGSEARRHKEHRRQENQVCWQFAVALQL